MNPPVLREAIRLPDLPRVPVRAVVTLHERRVDRPAHPRTGQRRLQPRGGAEDQPRRHLDHPTLLPRLVHRGIMQPRGGHLVRAPRPAPLAGPRRHHLVTERLQDRPLIGRVLVGLDQHRGPAPNRPLTSVPNSTTAPVVRSRGTTATTSRCSGSNATWSQQSPRYRSSGSSSSQFFSFLATNAHFSSIWSSRVSGERATSSSCAARAWSPAARP